MLRPRTGDPTETAPGAPAPLWRRAAWLVAAWAALGFVFAAAGRAGPVAAPGLGRDAASPLHIPPRGWTDVLRRLVRDLQQDGVTRIAGSVAFFSLLALFPALAAFVSLYGLFADIQAVRDHLTVLAGFIPADALVFLGEQMGRLSGTRPDRLSLAFAISLAVSLWSANAGVKALFDGLNIVYGEREKRGFIRRSLMSLAFTAGALVFAAAAFAAVVALPIVLKALYLDPAQAVIVFLRWPGLMLLAVAGFALLYRFGPSRQQARWDWILVGSVAAAALWLAGSLIFSWLVSEVIDYAAAYGPLGAVIGFLTWVWLTSIVVLAGAELNAQLELQTAEDSTTGPPRPMGARGAVVADTLGETFSAPTPPRAALPALRDRLLARIGRKTS